MLATETDRKSGKRVNNLSLTQHWTSLLQ